MNNIRGWVRKACEFVFGELVGRCYDIQYKEGLYL